MRRLWTTTLCVCLFLEVGWVDPARGDDGVADEYPVMPISGIEALTIQADDQEYSLGFPVRLLVTLTVSLDVSVAIESSLDPADGYMKVYIAYEEGNYRQYHGPGWGYRCTLTSRILASAASPARSEVTLLYNKVPQVGHLSEDYAERIEAANVMSAVAFDRVGRYRVKAVLFNRELTSWTESNEVEIVVDEPRGFDLAAWATLQSAVSDYAYLVHAKGTRHWPGTPMARRSLEWAEQVAVTHPGSNYGAWIRDALRVYRSSGRPIEPEEIQ